MPNGTPTDLELILVTLDAMPEEMLLLHEALPPQVPAITLSGDVESWGGRLNLYLTHPLSMLVHSLKLYECLISPRLL